MRKKVTAATLTLAPVELPSDEIMKQLDLGLVDVGDFAICLNIIKCQMDGMTVTDACLANNVSRYNMYEPHWKTLMEKARRLTTGYLMQNTQAAAQKVYSRWDEIIDSMINVALNGGRDHEKVQAAELLFNAYILPVQTTPQDDSKEAEYMRKPKNFNNLTPIQVLEGGTVIINAKEEK